MFSVYYCCSHQRRNGSCEQITLGIFNLQKEWIRAREENILKQKEQAAAERLIKLQKSAKVQIDERVNERLADKMDSTVVATVQNMLVDNLNPNAFKETGPRKHKKKHGSKLDDKKHK